MNDDLKKLGQMAPAGTFAGGTRPCAVAGACRL